MTILLIRHGETALNVARVLQPADTPLSRRGRQQAAALARRLRTAGIVAVVSSDLPRALETAEALAAACGLVVETTPLLQERNFGDWRGRPYDDIGHDPLTLADAPPGGESLAVFRDRVCCAFEDLRRRRALLAGPMAVVTHGLVLETMLRTHLHLPDGLVLPGRVGNASLTICEAMPPHVVSRLACRQHLGVDGIAEPGGPARD